MKKIAAFLIIAFATISVWAQSPQGFSYQAVLRNTDGTFVSSRQISVRVGIRHGSATGNEAYAETHSTTTTAEGLFGIVVGQGNSLVNCTFANCIDWANGPWFLKTDVDPNGGTHSPRPPGEKNLRCFVFVRRGWRKSPSATPHSELRIPH